LFLNHFSRSSSRRCSTGFSSGLQVFVKGTYGRIRIGIFPHYPGGNAGTNPRRCPTPPYVTDSPEPRFIHEHDRDVPRVPAPFTGLGNRFFYLFPLLRITFGVLLSGCCSSPPMPTEKTVDSGTRSPTRFLHAPRFDNASRWCLFCKRRNARSSSRVMQALFLPPGGFFSVKMVMPRSSHRCHTRCTVRSRYCKTSATCDPDIWSFSLSHIASICRHSLISFTFFCSRKSASNTSSVNAPLLCFAMPTPPVRGFRSP
jgi:hypothetical protein